MESLNRQFSEKMVNKGSNLVSTTKHEMTKIQKRHKKLVFSISHTYDFGSSPYSSSSGFGCNNFSRKKLFWKSIKSINSTTPLTIIKRPNTMKTTRIATNYLRRRFKIEIIILRHFFRQKTEIANFIFAHPRKISRC